jgi:hypothetical protein
VADWRASFFDVINRQFNETQSGGVTIWGQILSVPLLLLSESLKFFETITSVEAPE